MFFDERFGYTTLSPDLTRRRFGVLPGMRVLETGCGAGALARFLIPALRGRGEYVGVDSDDVLVEEARARTPAEGIALRFEVADARRLPFGAREFDAVVSQFLLCVVPRPAEVLQEMVRVARPGAVVASVSCFCKSGGLPRFRGVGDSPEDVRLEELESRFREIYRTKLRNPGLGLGNAGDLDVWAAYREVGLRELRIEGYLPIFAPADADWSDERVAEYVERRERIDLGLIDGLSSEAIATLEAGGFASAELRELRALMGENFARLRSEIEAARDQMDVWADPTVLITGSVPRDE